MQNSFSTIRYVVMVYYIYIINLTVATISFNQSAYSVNENEGPVQPVLVLSNPSSTDVTVQVKDGEDNATGCLTITY